MNNSWTYGQYSIFRIIFGIYLIIHFIYLLPWGAELFSNKGMLPNGSLSPLYHLFPNILLLNDSPLTINLLLCIGVLSGICLLLGKKDRYAAILSWYILTCVFDRNPLIANPSLPYIGWLLLAHSCLPSYEKAKYTWKMPKGIFFAAWIAMAVGYSYSGYTKLVSPSWLDGSAFKYVLLNPLAHSNLVTDILLSMPELGMKFLTWSALLLELSFAPLALYARIRPWLWLMLLAMHIGLLFIVRFPDLSFGMIILHLFTFNPEWIKPKNINYSLQVFYDGSCGLCHNFIRFTLSENIHTTSFVFMPLQGKAFQELVKREDIKSLPDSIVVYDPDSKILFYKSKAIIRVLENLGGLWRCIAYILKLIPLRISNVGYDMIARIRHKLFRKPDAICSVLPREWKQFILSD